VVPFPLRFLQSGRTVAPTIHQPSSRLFHSFDKLLLLWEGCSIFFGQAADGPWATSERLGFTPKFATNPADFMLDLGQRDRGGASLPPDFEDRPRVAEEEPWGSSKQTSRRCALPCWPAAPIGRSPASPWAPLAPEPYGLARVPYGLARVHVPASPLAPEPYGLARVHVPASPLAPEPYGLARVHVPASPLAPEPYGLARVHVPASPLAPEPYGLARVHVPASPLAPEPYGLARVHVPASPLALSLMGLPGARSCFPFGP